MKKFEWIFKEAYLSFDSFLNTIGHFWLKNIEQNLRNLAILRHSDRLLSVFNEYYSSKCQNAHCQ